jgi:uroporphyrinogen III methyltransferase/synthase
MGMRKLGTLMQLLIENGRSPATPAAVIHAASLPEQRTIVGTVADIAERASGLGMPALTIVGDVVALRDQLRWYDVQPLFGKRVLITRPLHQQRDIATMLRDEGAEPICVPAIRIAPPDDPGPLARAIGAPYRWIVFTSANGVSAFFDEVDRQGKDARVFGAARVCAIGPATAEALRARGIRADVVPDEFRGEGAAEAIIAADPDLDGARVLLARAAVAREALPDMLRARGALVDVVPAYSTLGPTDEDGARLRDAAATADVITFTSPSTVREVTRAVGPNVTATIACIGPVTADAAKEHGWPVHVVAADYTARGLVAALRDHFLSEVRP